MPPRIHRRKTIKANRPHISRRKLRKSGKRVTRITPRRRSGNYQRKSAPVRRMGNRERFELETYLAGLQAVYEFAVEYGLREVITVEGEPPTPVYEIEQAIQTIEAQLAAGKTWGSWLWEKKLPIAAGIVGAAAVAGGGEQP